jgi:hypothetical protein
MPALHFSAFNLSTDNSGVVWGGAARAMRSYIETGFTFLLYMYFSFSPELSTVKVALVDISHRFNKEGRDCRPRAQSLWVSNSLPHKLRMSGFHQEDGERRHFGWSDPKCGKSACVCVLLRQQRKWSDRGSTKMTYRWTGGMHLDEGFLCVSKALRRGSHFGGTEVRTCWNMDQKTYVKSVMKMTI